MAKVHGKNARVYLDGYDVSGDSNSIEPGYAADTVDVSCFSDTTHTYVVGLPDPQVRHAGVYNDAASRIHAVASARIGSMVGLDIHWGDTSGSGLPTVGGTVGMTEYTVTSAINAAVAVSAAYAGGDTRGIWEYGTTIQFGTVKTSVSGPTGVDLGTGFVAANGTVAYHVQSIFGQGSYILQSNTAALAADAGWTNRATIVGTAPTALRGTYAGGTVQEFWRIVCNVGGSGTAWAGIYRIS